MYKNFNQIIDDLNFLWNIYLIIFLIIFAFFTYLAFFKGFLSFEYKYQIIIVILFFTIYFVFLSYLKDINSKIEGYIKTYKEFEKPNIFKADIIPIKEELLSFKPYKQTIRISTFLFVIFNIFLFLILIMIATILYQSIPLASILGLLFFFYCIIISVRLYRYKLLDIFISIGLIGESFEEPIEEYEQIVKVLPNYEVIYFDALEAYNLSETYDNVNDRNSVLKEAQNLIKIYLDNKMAHKIKGIDLKVKIFCKLEKFQESRNVLKELSNQEKEKYKDEIQKLNKFINEKEEITPNNIIRIIEKKDERLSIEFKGPIYFVLKQLDNKKKNELACKFLKTITGLANQKGGTLIIGVDDKKRLNYRSVRYKDFNLKTIIPKLHDDSERETLKQTLQNWSIKYCSPKIPLDLYWINIRENQDVLIIKIPETTNNPIGFKDPSKPNKYYFAIRSGDRIDFIEPSDILLNK